MEFVIGVGIGAVIALIAGKRKRHSRQSKTGPSPDDERRRLQKADEELITIVLPAINNDR